MMKNKMYFKNELKRSDHVTVLIRVIKLRLSTALCLVCRLFSSRSLPP